MTHRVPPDLSFERGDRPLSQCLLDLISADKSARDVAAKIIDSIWQAAPDYESIPFISRVDLHHHQSRFKEKIRSVVNEIDFPIREFVPSLIALRIRADEELLRLLTNRASKFDGELHAATKVVFESLAQELLLDRVGLRKMLLRPGHLGNSDESLLAIARIGPAASEYYDILLELLDRGTDGWPWHVPAAVAMIARGDNVKLSQLMERLRSRTGRGWRGAVWAVEELGTGTGDLSGQFIDYLLNALQAADWDERSYSQIIMAVASVGRNNSDVLDVVIGFATTTAPRWSGKETAKNNTYDIMLERGIAIDALKYFQSFSDRVLPVLIKALDDFKEFDTDLLYYGERYRVCRAIASFGPKASIAIPVLSQMLTGYLSISRACPAEEFVTPSDLCELVAAIGPEARSLENVLVEYRRREMESGLFDENDSEDALTDALASIRKSIPLETPR